MSETKRKVASRLTHRMLTTALSTDGTMSDMVQGFHTIHHPDGLITPLAEKQQRLQ